MTRNESPCKQREIERKLNGRILRYFLINCQLCVCVTVDVEQIDGDIKMYCIAGMTQGTSY